jgi:membrane-associated phospholipid phosphatase
LAPPPVVLDAPNETVPIVVSDHRSRARTAFDNLLQDERNFYSLPSLGALTAAFGAGAIMANTNIDQNLNDDYQNHVGYQSDIHAFKTFGEGTYMIPAYFASYLVGRVFEERPIGALFVDYGERTVRASLVGGLPMLLMQEVTGAGRPGEHPTGSHWEFFQDNNGVSGHAFVGGVTFISAAKMTERPVLKAAFYGLSIMPALSRINDEAHYPSQAFLGWFMAYAAATAVDNTQRGNTNYRFFPYFTGNTTGVLFEYRR